MTRSAKRRGFTLIELMVVVATIAILAAIGVPSLRIYMLEGRLGEAKPYLMALSAKEQAYRRQYGSYYGSASEDTLIQTLGVNLAETGNFCFIVVCVDGTGTPAKCNPTTPSATNFAQSPASTETIDYEVWAVLRGSSSGSVLSTNGLTCTASTTATTLKPDPAGWVQAATSTDRGREGQTVVLRYPPPADGLRTGSGGTDQQWQAGLSTYNAENP